MLAPAGAQQLSMHRSPLQQWPTCPGPHGAPPDRHEPSPAHAPSRQSRLLQSCAAVHGLPAPSTGTQRRPPSVGRQPSDGPHIEQSSDSEPHISSLVPSTHTVGASGRQQRSRPEHAQVEGEPPSGAALSMGSDESLASARAAFASTDAGAASTGGRAASAAVPSGAIGAASHPEKATNAIAARDGRKTRMRRMMTSRWKRCATLSEGRSRPSRARPASERRAALATASARRPGADPRAPPRCRRDRPRTRRSRSGRPRSA